MADRKRLSSKQLAVIADMFSGELDEQAVLSKHKVGRSLYSRWLTDELFCAEFDRRIASAHRRTAALIAGCASLAAAKLVELTESENQETARKACLDVIAMPLKAAANSRTSDQPEKNAPEQTEQLPPQTAARLLAALAQDNE